MPTRTARTAWNGTLEQGAGQVGLHEDGFTAAAEKAARRSKALTGTTITLDAGLEQVARGTKK